MFYFIYLCYLTPPHQPCFQLLLLLETNSNIICKSTAFHSETDVTTPFQNDAYCQVNFLKCNLDSFQKEHFQYSGSVTLIPIDNLNISVKFESALEAVEEKPLAFILSSISCPFNCALILASIGEKQTFLG